MKNIAIIPARGGSKGLKDKNIMLLCGKPLLAYSIEAAIKSNIFDEIMVSTDSVQYADLAQKHGAKVPFLRSRELAADQASSWDTVREVLSKYKASGKIFDTICLLQPTSPLRESADINNAYMLYELKKAKTVISVCETEHSPLWENELPDSLSMEHFIKSDCNIPRQSLPVFYRINGAIYITDTENIINNVDIYKNSYAYIMPGERSVDIDTKLDFCIAEAIKRKQLIDE